jgi:type IV pilus assembly protein PilY1
MPTANICGFGGQTFVWVVTGMAGGTPPASSLKGKLILQLSTGAFETVDLSTALQARENRRTGLGNSSNDTPTQGYTGGTSKDNPPEQKPPKGIPRILQIREQ